LEKRGPVIKMKELIDKKKKPVRSMLPRKKGPKVQEAYRGRITNRKAFDEEKKVNE